MGLYNFQKRFEPHIRSGRKRHTIRSKRKHRDKPGNPFYGYTGLRTKYTSKILQSTVTRVEDIRIRRRPLGIVVEGIALSADECDALAFADGFENFADMMSFWTGRTPFSGDLIHFDYDNAVFAPAKEANA